MPTIQERRRNDLATKLTMALERRDDLLRKLCRNETHIASLQRGLKRYDKRVEKLASTVQTPAKDIAKVFTPTTTVCEVTTPPEEIPAYLRRTPANNKDAEARAEIEAEQAERKRAKARARIANMKAKQSGETKRMPLTGKAALAAIRGE